MEEQSSIAERTRGQKHEAAGHTASVVSKQKEVQAGAQLASSVLLGVDFSLWNVATLI